MGSFRRKLASCALAVVLLQFALLFAVPVMACCVTRGATAPAAATVECCPPGSHAPGACPLHKGTRAATGAMRCDSGFTFEFIVGLAGVLPAPGASLAAPSITIVRAAAPVPVRTRSFLPDAPPPKSL